MRLARYCNGCDICTDERLDELSNLSVGLERSLLDEIYELSENHAEYYMMLGQVAVDLCATCMIDFQTFVDTVKMEVALSHMEDE